eukprot:Lankesteria_metandrocarpae@DN5139_c0_g1_i10.p1
MMSIFSKAGITTSLCLTVLIVIISTDLAVNSILLSVHAVLDEYQIVPVHVNPLYGGERTNSSDDEDSIFSSDSEESSSRSHSLDEEENGSLRDSIITPPSKPNASRFQKLNNYIAAINKRKTTAKQPVVIKGREEFQQRDDRRMERALIAERKKQRNIVRERLGSVTSGVSEKRNVFEEYGKRIKTIENENENENPKKTARKAGAKFNRHRMLFEKDQRAATQVDRSPRSPSISRRSSSRSHSPDEEESPRSPSISRRSSSRSHSPDEEESDDDQSDDDQSDDDQSDDDQSDDDHSKPNASRFQKFREEFQQRDDESVESAKSPRSPSISRSNERRTTPVVIKGREEFQQRDGRRMERALIAERKKQRNIVRERLGSVTSGVSEKRNVFEEYGKRIKTIENENENENPKNARKAGAKFNRHRMLFEKDQKAATQVDRLSL